MFLFEGVVHPAELEQRLVHEDLAATGTVQYNTLHNSTVHWDSLWSTASSWLQVRIEPYITGFNYKTINTGTQKKKKK